MSNGNQIVYIPEYVEQGIAKLQDAKRILEDIATEIESGISIINGSGYNRGIPYIEKGDTAAVSLEKMQNIISVITSEIEKYSNGAALELESAIIVANPETIEKYGLSKEDIDYTLDEYIFESNVSPKWDSNYLTASAGTNLYTGADGRLVKETWCDLDPTNLVRLMKKQGIELDFWIREDGVYMYGDYVMVAADIPHMDGSEQEAEYRKGDLVETSLGTGIVVDYCGMAEKVRKKEFAGTRFADVGVWYDVYTAWHDEGQYQHVGYCDDASCTSTHHGQSTMIEKVDNPTSSSQLRDTTASQATTSNDVFNATSIEKNEIIVESSIATTIASSANASTTPPTGSTSTGTSSNNTTSQTVPPTTNNTNTSTTTNTESVITGETTTNETSSPIIQTAPPVTNNTDSSQNDGYINQETITQEDAYQEIETTEPNQELISSQVTPEIKNDKDVNENTIITNTVETTEEKNKFNPLPLLAGIGAAAAAGVGVKVYNDTKKKKEANEYDSSDDYEELEEI